MCDKITLPKTLKDSTVIAVLGHRLQGEGSSRNMQAKNILIAIGLFASILQLGESKVQKSKHDLENILNSRTFPIQVSLAFTRHWEALIG